jgi:hypothetical protein
MGSGRHRAGRAAGRMGEEVSNGYTSAFPNPRCESTGCQIQHPHYVSEHAPPRPDAPVAWTLEDRAAFALDTWKIEPMAECLRTALARLAAIEKAARAVLKMTEDVDHIEIITVGAMEKIDALRDALEKP